MSDHDPIFTQGWQRTRERYCSYIHELHTSPKQLTPRYTIPHRMFSSFDVRLENAALLSAPRSFPLPKRACHEAIAKND